MGFGLGLLMPERAPAAETSPPSRILFGRIQRQSAQVQAQGEKYTTEITIPCQDQGWTVVHATGKHRQADQLESRTSTVWGVRQDKPAYEVMDRLEPIPAAKCYWRSSGQHRHIAVECKEEVTADLLRLLNSKCLLRGWKALPGRSWSLRHATP